MGNLVLETSKNKSVDYEYNELNQLVKKTTSQNEVYTYSYDKRGNRTAETGKKASQSFVYDATNRMVEGTNWKGDKSAYTYNGLGLRVNNLVTTHAGKTYDRDYVIDYTSPENDDLYVYAMGNGQLEYEQRHVYAGSERLEQITEKGKGGWERTLYVHEDVMGNTRYYTKATGQNFAELQYDAWGQPDSPNKLVNNDHGNYVFATFTGHTYDPVLDIYFAEARFYDATNRTWMARDPAKDGLNWYQYALSNPTTYWDPSGLWAMQNKTNNYYTLLSCEGENPIQEFLDGIVDWFVGIFQRGKEVIRWGGGSANSGAGAGRKPQPTPTPTPTPIPTLPPNKLSTVGIKATWIVYDDYYEYYTADESDMAVYQLDNMNRQKTTKEGLPSFLSGSWQKAMANDAHSYADPESGIRRFALELNADGTPKQDLINDYYVVALSRGMLGTAEDLLHPGTEGAHNAYTFKITLQDESGEEYSFNAITGDAKGNDLEITSNPSDPLESFFHDHAIEFQNDDVPSEWEYQRTDNLISPADTVGQISLNAIASRISGKDETGKVIQVSKIQLYDQPAFFSGRFGQGWSYEGG